MNARTRIAAAALAFVTAAAPGAYGGNGGTPDTAHPNVGALLIHPFPGAFYLVCSGTLVAPDKFLTAGHCLHWAADAGFGAKDFVVSFDADLEGTPNGQVTPGDVRPVASYAVHPRFLDDNGWWAANDLAVVTLAAPALGVVPAELPEADLLDREAARGGLTTHDFVNVGYGVDPTETGPRAYEFDGVRKVSTSPYKGLTQDMLHLNMQENATDGGGSCFGDSGGPKFWSLTGPRANLIVATVAGGDRACRAHSYNIRLDTASNREFLAQHVVLP